MKILLAITVGLLLPACQSIIASKIGETEEHWLKNTLVGDLVYAEGNYKAWKSGGIYYYFKDGVLVKINEGMIPRQRIDMVIQSEQKITTPASKDLYSELKKLDELRKEEIITDQEFETQKKRLLEEH